MSIDVKKVAHLARLALTPEEIASYSAKLEDIMQMLADMNRIDTTGIDPMSHPLDMVQRLRPDVVTETDQRATFQKIAPNVLMGLYLVPLVIE